MIFGDLPPVGHKISLRSGKHNPLSELLGMNQHWVDSGTSALALALMDAKARFSHVQNPRAIIPGYCCPDLVAACVYAGVEPLAIDINADDPAYDIEQLRTYLDDNVVAIIAVNFLGIRERMAELRELISGMGLQARLIEDNAQWFPSQKSAADFISDYVVFSFGRGKPLSLLGGGLLLSATPLSDSVAQHIAPAESSSLLPFKIRAYNLLLWPPLYIFLNRNPLLSLGQTRYIPLEGIFALDEYRFQLLDENFERYCERNAEIVCAYHDVVRENNLQQLTALDSARAQQLLRYPLLCQRPELRDELLVQMTKAGLGATAMYAAAIDRIEGVSGRVHVPAALNNANYFAQRLITLPVHAGVGGAYRDKILTLLHMKIDAH